MKIYFLRHGESEANAGGRLGGRLDSPLTQKGQEQAQRAAPLVKNIHPDVIFTSPLKRAYDTAQAVAEASGLEPIVDERLIERGVGVLEGADNQNGALKVSTTPDDTEGAEPIADVIKRAQGFLDMLSDAYADKTILLVGHGATFKIFLSLVTSTPWDEMKHHLLPNAVPFKTFEEVHDV